MKSLTRCCAALAVVAGFSCLLLAQETPPKPEDANAPPPAKAAAQPEDPQPQPPPRPVPPRPQEPAPPAGPAEPEALAPEMRRELDKLSTTIQDRMSVDPTLQTARLTGWRIAKPEENVRRLELELSAFDEPSAQALEQLARDEIARSTYWTAVDPPLTEVVVTTRLRPPARPGLAVRYFQIGSKAFWCCDPSTARTAFQAAMADSTDPARRYALNYWIALCDLQLGRTDLVHERLSWLLDTDPQGSSSPAIATELQRVQGPLRSALLLAERDVLMARVRPANSYNAPPPPPAAEPAAVPRRPAAAPEL